MKDPVKDKLKRFELFERFGIFYPTIGAPWTLTSPTTRWTGSPDRDPSAECGPSSRRAPAPSHDAASAREVA
jgi:hypothetical protein